MLFFLIVTPKLPLTPYPSQLPQHILCNPPKHLLFAMQANYGIHIINIGIGNIGIGSIGIANIYISIIGIVNGG